MYVYVPGHMCCETHQAGHMMLMDGLQQERFESYLNIPFADLLPFSILLAQDAADAHYTSSVAGISAAVSSSWPLSSSHLLAGPPAWLQFALS